VGGMASGLAGTVVLQNNGGDNLSVSANGAFTFHTALASSAAYKITVMTQPAGQNCVVSNGSGNVGTANVTGISVNCASQYTVGGTLTGLNGTVVLQDNGANDLSLTANGDFKFGSAVASGTAYAVTVLTQPSGQTCTVNNGAGSVGTANVTGVAVNCTHSGSADSLSGTYHGVGYIVDGTNAVSALGTAVVSGGNYTTTTQSVNFNSIIVPPSGLPGPGSGTYTVTSAGALTLTPAAAGAVPSVGGVLGADGGAYATLVVTDGKSPTMLVSVKEGSGVTLASIAGDYTLVRLSSDNSSSEGDLETFTLKSDGTYDNGSATVNVSGTITQAMDSGAVTVSANGILSNSGSAGAISANGDLFVIHDIQAGEWPALIIGVRRGTGVTAATLSGTYTAVSLTGEMNGVSGGSAGSVGTVVFDGKGNFAVTNTDNEGGTISTGSGAGTYTVQSDGTLTISVGGSTLHGAVSADGNVVVLSDVESGDKPGITVALRQ
jgi:hypothetical protein